MKLYYSILCMLFYVHVIAQNPIITERYTADPAPHVWDDGKLWLYTTTDETESNGYGEMQRYHVYSTWDLEKWTDHGEILHINDISWAKSHLWDYDCFYHQGKYYLYFVARAKADNRFHIGVAISDYPEGPFSDVLDKPMEGLIGTELSPVILKDDDGEIYMYYHKYVARLKDNLLEIAEVPKLIDYDGSNFGEAPWVFKCKGLYYYTYHNNYWKTDEKSEIHYGIGYSPYGPFKNFGMVGPEPPVKHSNQQGVVEFCSQWYWFYHTNALCNYRFWHRRSVCVDSLFINEDHTLVPIIMTHQGVGKVINPNKPEIWEENNSQIIFKGKWEAIKVNSKTDQIVKRSVNQGDSFSFIFEGNRVRIFGNKGLTAASIDVYLDGEFVKTLDLYSSHDLYEATYYDSGLLEKSKHRIQVFVAGGEMAQDAGYKVDIDKIEIFEEFNRR